MNLDASGRVSNNDPLIKYASRTYAGMNASDHLQRVDSLKINCNPRWQLSLVSGNSSRRRNSCYRRGCGCCSRFLCISVCGCEKRYANVSPEKTMSIRERNTLDKNTEKLTLKQITSIDYDDAMSEWKRVWGMNLKLVHCAQRARV
ncbi:hypothetical protein HJC23_003585 [Cyclotella cryptica]|uniref:Uncharacterized protein n=1 Tax=Cyclotella cryptica TaxID=29204 RepID=A0ABD3NUX3_9STRA|eukprot:CCRYP_019487-RA/>CCRYP_019487-RA protein AED:0.32 eAED:0.32 QI:76/1/1/1/0/0/2/550/145